MTDTNTPSLLPYEAWATRALRSVAVDALEHAAREGLPGEHHFYISFRTDHPGTSIPAHLKAKYPHEITIVIQHRFWDLKVDRVAQRFSVGLSFSGIPASLVVPFAALTAFQDPHAQFGLRFQPEYDGEEDAADLPPPEVAAAPAETPETPAPAPQPQVVSLDAFRRKRD
ncbi:MAG TPA: ClpXP protease specificity-enhancing factor SspB [Roseococcus sp.]|jgi:hypothetical protein|nr:ClpXP protease specificity-enhancing factor SspB [Roseococcus sp.]